MVQPTLTPIYSNQPITWVNSVFARHETFHPRFGWLKKGFDAAKKNPEVFLKEDATVHLGVGKNMVRSIRYWCNTFKVLEGDKPSEFGSKLFEKRGWDPFCENPASLWLLHWNLLKPSCNAAAWYFTFNRFHRHDFTVDDLFNDLSEYCNNNLGSRTAESSLKKDISCILRMYVPQPLKGQISEDSLDCPFTELGLLHTAGDSRRYSFRVGEKKNLPPEIIVSACLEYTAWMGSQKTIALSRLLYDSSSPGMVFKLTESAICDAIEKVSRQFNSLYLSDTAGLIQFAFNDEPVELATEILRYYYN
ncbi:DUF4007 family protein [Okeania sp. KiyG1]|uniref:DUF4007 family protein n=1 Tax=Okeania sp. KiyG1 TaxID=2720165 RepID=UPI001922A71F|nr:DUF4007 family protein [Okeania sp. KiyG1]GGA00886.1 hypothetical protein CYANOKiyG1_12630 [Okeania sp. KiyG1]